MRALLLAAGIGSRLAPLTNALPKCLVPIHGVPLLAYWLDALSACGVEHFLVNTHYRAAQVEQFVGNSRWAGQVELLYEPELLGTGGTLLANRSRWQDDELMLVHADNLCHCDLDAFVAAHHARPADIQATMMTFNTPTPSSCGVVTVGPDNRLTGFYEKKASPPGNRASAAVFVLAPAFTDTLASLDDNSSSDFSRDIIPEHLAKFQAWHNAEYLSDIGTPSAYLRAQLDYAWPPLRTAPATSPSGETLAALKAIAGADWEITANAEPGFSSANTYRQTGRRILAGGIKESP